MAIEINIPKRVGGFKIDKEIRRRAKKTLKMAQSPAMRGLAQAAIHIARQGQDAAREAAREAKAGAHAAAAEAREAFREARAETRQWAEDQGYDWKEKIDMCDTRIHIDGNRIAETFRAAAIAGLRTLLEGLEEGVREAKEAAAKREAAAKAEAEPAPKAKAKPRRAKAKASAPKSEAGAARGAPGRP